MLRVYLDEMKWIDLSRAVHGDERGKPYQEAALVIGEAVEQGQASFPLSMGHYIETWRKRRATRRRRLDRTMAAFSLNHAIAPHLRLLRGSLIGRYNGASVGRYRSRHSSHSDGACSTARADLRLSLVRARGRAYLRRFRRSPAES
jgi:hypothetical protein